MSANTLHKALSVIRNPWNQQHAKRVAELWLCDEVERLSIEPTRLTDADIIEIRDNHLPSQGEAFDCIAFAREVIHCAGIRPRKPPAPTVLSALEAAEEYFESRADAEYFTDRAAPVGNTEMHLLGEMREAIAVLKAQKP